MAGPELKVGDGWGAGEGWEGWRGAQGRLGALCTVLTPHHHLSQAAGKGTAPIRFVPALVAISTAFNG